MEEPRTIIIRLGKFMDILGGIFVTCIVLLTVCDVILRYFGVPILGAYEIVSLGGALAMGISSFFTYWKKSHIRVDTFVEKMPKNISHILYIVTRVMILFIVGLTGVSLIVIGFHLLEVREVTATLRFPYYPVVWVMGVAFLIVSLSMVYELISSRGNR